jgi:altronate dehydratase large subunit
MEFQGYAREDGSFGIRNHLLVVSTVACANPVVEAIGRELPDAVPLTPGYDVESMAALAAAGSQMILFTTGRGSPTGCPAVPVVKIASNSRIFESMPGDLDINAGTIIDAGVTVDEMGREIFDRSLEVASGRRTCAEINRFASFGYLKRGPSL